MALTVLVLMDQQWFRKVSLWSRLFLGWERPAPTVTVKPPTLEMCGFSEEGRLLISFSALLVMSATSEWANGETSQVEIKHNAFSEAFRGLY